MHDKNLPYRNVVRVLHWTLPVRLRAMAETSGPLKAGSLLFRDLIEFTQRTSGTRC